MKKQLTESLNQKVKNEQFSGVVAIWQQGKPLFEHVCGFAHRGWQIKNGMDTRFRLASISKMFTAVSILQLIEQNRLNFATPIADLLDLSQTTISPTVTIQHLLTMSSGIADWFEESENWEADWAALIRERPLYLLRKNADYLPLFSQKPANFSAGQRYQYSNASYILLGLAIEAISNQPYFEYVRQHVFAAANMSHADFIGLDAVAPNLAEGYIRHENGETWQKNIYSTTPDAAADGGAVATAVDLFHFLEGLRNGRLLSQKLTQAMITPQISQSDQLMSGYFWQYGYGNEFVFDQNKRLLRWGHTGEEDGVSCRLYHYPDQRLDVIILGNQSWCAGDLGWEIHKFIIK